jgi:hypothetical protein
MYTYLYTCLYVYIYVKIRIDLCIYNSARRIKLGDSNLGEDLKYFLYCPDFPVPGGPALFFLDDGFTFYIYDL